MHHNFWNYLFETIELIEGMDNGNPNIIEQVSTRLEAIELLFARQFDPADSYQEYIAVKLIHTIAKAIKKQKHGPTDD